MTAPARRLDQGTSTIRVHPIPPATQDTDPLVARNRAVWMAGDFEHIAAGYRASAAEFVAGLRVEPGERVLDVACGTGNLTLPAARGGAVVVGVDIAPNLLATGRQRAGQEGLNIQFDEGNAEALPYADGSFDTVISMFGAMFAPRPERVASELLRVVRPGGRIAMANWTPGSFVGAMLRAHTALVPPPSGVPSTLLWGDDTAMRERLAGARRVTLTRRTIHFDYPMPPHDLVQLFRDWYGPTIKTFEALDAQGQTRLFGDLVALWSDHNRASDGTTRVDSEYLEVIAER